MKKLLTSLLLGIILTFFSVGSVSAQTPAAGGPWYNQTFDQWFNKVYDDTNPQEIFGERYTAAQVQWVVYSLAAIPLSNTKDVVNCAFSGDDTLCVKGLKSLIVSSDKLPSLATREPDTRSVWLRVFDDRPLSGITYVKDQFRKFHLIPEAQAQTSGFGYDALNPVRPLWKAFRDASYLLFTVIIIAFAFMIMFRVKISPQTVISVQSALPKLIIGLVLVTFSYAIAGFMVDLMYVLIAIIASVFRISFGNVPILSQLVAQGSENVIYTFMAGGTQITLIYYLICYFLLFIIALLLALVYTVVSSFVNMGLTAGFLSVASPYLVLILILAVVIFIFMLAWKCIKITLLIIKTIANIFMLTIFAPIQITFGIISPGSGFNSWLKNLIANLLVFPAAGLLLILAMYFLLESVAISLIGIGFDNAIIDGIGSLAAWALGGSATVSISSIEIGTFWNVPLLGSGFTGLVFLGASYTILSIVPKAAEFIQSLIAGKPFAYGSAIGEGMAPLGFAAGFVPGYMKTLQGKSTNSGLGPIEEKLNEAYSKHTAEYDTFLTGVSKQKF